jgi:hypothetical protein
MSDARDPMTDAPPPAGPFDAEEFVRLCMALGAQGCRDAVVVGQMAARLRPHLREPA